MREVLHIRLLVPEVLQRIRPQEVAHRPERRRLFESVQLFDVVQRMDLRRQTCEGREGTAFI